MKPEEYHDPLVEPFMRRLMEVAPDLTEEQLRDIRRTASAPADALDCLSEEAVGPKRGRPRNTKTPGH